MAGNNSPMSMPMMAITTKSSTSVNPADGFGRFMAAFLLKSNDDEMKEWKTLDGKRKNTLQ